MRQEFMNKMKSTYTLILIFAVILVATFMIEPVLADVTMTCKPESCTVCNGVTINITVANDQSGIFFDEKNFTVTTPKGKKSEYDKGGVAIPSGKSISVTYPKPNPNWDPDGRCDEEGTYTVTLKYRQDGEYKEIKCFFNRAKTCGGIAIPVNKFNLLAPYIGLASTMLVATFATAICAKRMKHKREKQ